MFRGSPTDSAQDARLQRLLGMVKEEFFAVDQTGAGLDFATISNAAHEAGRKVARLLCEQTASRCAESAEHEQPCPGCGQASPEPSKSDRWRPATGRSPSKRHGTLVRDAGGSFSPNRPRQGLDHRGYSPTMRAILVAMAIAARSFAEAAKLAGIAAELKIYPATSRRSARNREASESMSKPSGRRPIKIAR